jgi:hypothetical protein
MVGMQLISIQGVTLREEQSPCFRPGIRNKGFRIALAAIPANTGSQDVVIGGSTRQTVAPFFLT